MKINLYNEDNKIQLKKMIDDEIFVDSIVTDPPYHLDSIVKRFGNKDSAKANYGSDGSFSRLSKDFMGQQWDGGDIAYDVEFWKYCYQILKPGGYLIAFSSAKTYHRMACAVEDSGFDIKDQLIWLYSTGFPKCRDMKKEIDKIDTSKSDEWQGWKNALKPAHEPMVLAQKPIKENSIAKNVLKQGVGAINIDECRINNIGKYPTNVIHDGSFEILKEFQKYNNDISKFFYCAKASKKEKGDYNTHPTVKPVKLMQYLVRMVTPNNKTVLDPFMGSGTTGVACVFENKNFIGIDSNKNYYNIAQKRIKDQNPTNELFDFVKE